MGDVHEEARTDPSWGNLSFWEPNVLESVSCRSRTYAKYLPSLHPVNLKINPPYSRHADDAPERSLLSYGTYGKPLQEKEVGQREGQQEREADGEEEDVERQVGARGLGRDRQERRYAGTFDSRASASKSCRITGLDDLRLRTLVSELGEFLHLSLCLVRLFWQIHAIGSNWLIKVVLISHTLCRDVMRTLVR